MAPFHTLGLGRLIDRTVEGRNSKLHAVCDRKMRIFAIHLTEGTASDYAGVKVLLEQLLKWINRLAADWGYDADWVRGVLESMGIEPCIPGKRIDLLPSNTTPSFTRSATKLSVLLIESKTGAGWQPAMTGARKSSSRLVLSQQLSSGGYKF